MSISKYIKVFDIGLQNTFVYRWNFFLRSTFGFVPLVGMVFIWKAIFAERKGDIGGYGYSSMIFYFLLTMLVNSMVTPTEDEWQIAAEIRDGLINAFLTKPLNYLGHRVSLFLSSRALYTFVTLLPVALVFLYFRAVVVFPHQGITWFFFALSLAMAAFIQFFIAYALAMMAFWILEISTIVFILYSFEYFLSGQMFPIDIMPGWVQVIERWLPFTYEIFFPVSIFLERVHGRELYTGLMIQTGWLIAMWILARVMWAVGVRHYQAVGG